MKQIRDWHERNASFGPLTFTTRWCKPHGTKNCPICEKNESDSQPQEMMTDDGPSLPNKKMSGMSPQRYDKNGIPFGHLRVENHIGPELEIYVGTAGNGTRELIILGRPWSEEESGQDEDKWHDCNAGGCGRPGSHVLARVDLDQLNKLPTLEGHQ